MIFWNKNKLTFLRQYESHDNYSTKNKFKNSSVDKIVKRFKKEIDDGDNISILSKFNNIHYPFFDLDTQDKYLLFKKINTELPYIIFRSSEGHYWGFSGVPYKNIKDIFIDYAWKVCNDEKYVKFSLNYGKQMIRGLYETYERLPYEIERSGEISDNFNSFIVNIKKYYQNEGFELSLAKYKDSELLEEMEIRRRKYKIERIRSRGNR